MLRFLSMDGVKQWWLWFVVLSKRGDGGERKVREKGEEEVVGIFSVIFYGFLCFMVHGFI